MRWAFWRRTKTRPVNTESPALVSLRAAANISAFAQKGYIFLDWKERKVMIADDLACLFMAEAEAWENFLKQVYFWVAYIVAQNHNRRVFVDAEVAAVRKAREENGNRPLLRITERMIRERARAAVDISQVPPPVHKGYDFVVVSVVDDQTAPTVISVGYYHPDGRFDMVDYDRIREYNKEREGQL